jgi:succinate dehydrogenase/fumarate reductase flavoprotein subunit
MLQVLIFALIAVVGVQALIIKGLAKELKDSKKNAREERIAYKKLIKELTKIASNYKKDVEDYKDAYNACYAEYKVIFREKKTIKKHLDYVEELHSHMVNNMHTLLKQGRVIKSKHMDTVIPYESFSNLSADDRYELFGA